MLAKIVKSDPLVEFSAPAFPSIGESVSKARHKESFAVPELSELISAKHSEGEIDEFQPVANPIIVSPTPRVDDVLQAAREEAARIIAEAEQNAAVFARAAEEKATQEIYARFESEVAAQADQIRLQLTQTIEQVSALSETISARHEKDLVELALQIAKKIVGREVTIDREIAFALVKVSLAKLHNRAVAEVHLNPDDLAFVETHRERLDFRGSLLLVEDKSVSHGGCLIHTESGEIDARIESQFDEIAHGLFT